MARMLCAECGATTTPRTRLPGSDRVEGIAWLLGGLPGLALCAWRHALRTKHCALCDAPAWARETRAASARAPVAPPSLRAAGEAGWPAHLALPRARMRRGIPCALLWGAVASGLPFLAALGAIAWLGAEFLWHRDATRGACGAWDATGRALHIELA